MTIPYYDQHGQAYHDKTVNVDMRYMSDLFLKYLPSEGHILDAGCGGGRDAKIFSNKGYRVTAFDGSKTMVEISHEYTGLPIEHMTFNDMMWEDEFDGIWANASLLHVPFVDLENVFNRFIKALKPGGIWYMSFGMGDHNAIDNRRTFTNFTETGMMDIIFQFKDIAPVEMIITKDVCPNVDKNWLNTFVIKRFDPYDDDGAWFLKRNTWL